MYQFPLIESENRLTYESFVSIVNSNQIINSKPFIASLYNEEEIIHKLSHQHLYTKFWIVKVDKLSNENISIKDINKHAVPVLIENFLKAFSF